MLIEVEEGDVVHYGTPRHSGRYPWGSGGDEASRSSSFLERITQLEAQGHSETAIAEKMGFAKYDKKTGDKTSSGTTQFRERKRIAQFAKEAADRSLAEKLKKKGMSNVAIGTQMGINESSVRALLAPGRKDRNAILHATKATIKDAVDKHDIVDIGAYVEKRMGVGRSKFDAAVNLLIEEGYTKTWINTPQLGTQYDTRQKVLLKPGITHAEAQKRKLDIQQITDYSDDGGHTYTKLHHPIAVDSKRVAVKWAEEGGDKADGMIYIRPGAKDLSLGHSRYAQVRVNVDDTHFLKGMAMYKDDLPKGVDVEFHTSKRKADTATGSKHEAMKALKKDAEGRVDFLKSIQRQRGALNIVQEEGEWDKWAKNLSSQMLSKQNPDFAKQQLDVHLERKKSQLAEIMSLTNPTVRKKLLDEFGDSADSSAVDLEAAGLHRTKPAVILPLEKIKPTEIYAPNFRNGEKVVLIRHPHGGVFEIPQLTVNNNNPAAKKVFGNSEDAVGIHHTVAQHLSGADFDGDTVLVIPNNRRQIKTEPMLAGLKDFDPKHMYPKYPGMKPMSDKQKQHEMGKVTNLLTDMTIKGASHDELVRALKHSMVVIDAEKHELNYKQSEIDNNIQALKIKWQGGATKGASTIVSRAGSDLRVTRRKQLVKINPRTGEKIFTEDPNATWVDAQGNTHTRKMKTTKMAETKDARTLAGDNGHNAARIELIYADHANRLKALANEARKTAVNTKDFTYSPSAAKVYATEVAALKAKLHIAQSAAPLERQAQIIGNRLLQGRIKADPNMDAETLKKIKAQCLAEGRARTGSSKTRIQITPAEWEAVQHGAITKGMLSNILDNADKDVVRKLATPKTPLLMTSSKKELAKRLLSRGYTQADVADQLDVSLSTLKSAIKEG